MQFNIGPIPQAREFYPEEGCWNRLREPGPGMMQLLALPVALTVGAFLGLASHHLGVLDFETLLPGPPDDLGEGSARLVLTLLGLLLALLHLLGVILLIILVHEGIHLLTHPGQGRRRDSILGLWPRRLLVYAHWDGELTRNRFLLILAAPFVCISLLPLAAVGLGLLESSWIGTISLFNGLAACGDVLGVIMIGTQVPASAIVRNKGYYTWWRRVEAETETGEAGD